MGYAFSGNMDDFEAQGYDTGSASQGWSAAPSGAALGQATPLLQGNAPDSMGPLAIALLVVGGFVALRLWVELAPDGE